MLEETTYRYSRRKRSAVAAEIDEAESYEQEMKQRTHSGTRPKYLFLPSKLIKVYLIRSMGLLFHIALSILISISQ